MATPKPSAQTISSIAALLGRRGGKRRAKNLTKAERLAGALKASRAAKRARRERRKRQQRKRSRS